jgi:hypothetical protein
MMRPSRSPGQIISIPVFFLYLFLNFNQDAMKKLSLVLACFFLTLGLSCTEDETIEEQIFKQENLNPVYSASGEEGDQELDRRTRD